MVLGLCFHRKHPPAGFILNQVQNPLKNEIPAAGKVVFFIAVCERTYLRTFNPKELVACRALERSGFGNNIPIVYLEMHHNFNIFDVCTV